MAAILTRLHEEISESRVQIITDFSQADQIQFVQPYLQSILYNLISNASKYRSPDRQAKIEVKTRRINEQTTCLTVSDNGLGIDLKQHGAKLFGLYKRFHLHKEGKGLGLYLVKTQMERW